MEAKWRAAGDEEYHTQLMRVLIRAADDDDDDDAAAVAQTNQDFAFSNYDGNKNKMLDGKTMAMAMWSTLGARALTHSYTSDFCFDSAKRIV